MEREYSEDEVYLSKAKALGQKYSYIRRTRPDGNCFFRAFSYAYLEKLIGNKDEYEKFKLVLSVIGFILSVLNLVTNIR